MSYSLKFFKGKLYYLDQTKLPLKEIYKECRSLKEGLGAIKRLEVRGAPLIGVFAGYCVYLGVKNFSSSQKNKFLRHLNRVVRELKSTRPTAVNLAWAVERIRRAVYNRVDLPVSSLKTLILKEARKIHQEDIQLCKRMAEYGVTLINSGDTILTHCNTGFLATSGIGTALGVIYQAQRRFKNIKVFVDETRPLLQGGRLTSWELKKKGIKTVLICDSMAGYLMQKKMIDKVLAGADRITACGDVANKIGTYTLAVAANHHKIPFYVVAPSTSFDLKIKYGDQIPIEERDPREIKKVLEKIQIAPPDIEVFNPAFDVTPHNLITAIVTEKGIIRPPFEENIKKMLL